MKVPLRVLIDKALNRGYVLSPLGGTSPPPGGAGLRLALHKGTAEAGPLPAAVEATTGWPISRSGCEWRRLLQIDRCAKAGCVRAFRSMRTVGIVRIQRVANRRAALDRRWGMRFGSVPPDASFSSPTLKPAGAGARAAIRSRRTGGSSDRIASEPADAQRTRACGSGRRWGRRVL